MLSRANRIRMFFRGTPVSAVIAALFGIVSAVIFVLTGIMSIIGRGEAGVIIGILGVAAMLLNVAGFSIAAGSTKGNSDDIYYGIPIFAVIINGVMFIIYMVFYIFGFLVSI